MSTIFAADSQFKENSVDSCNLNLISGSEDVQTAGLQTTKPKNCQDKTTMSNRSYDPWIAQNKMLPFSKGTRFFLEDQKLRCYLMDWMLDLFGEEFPCQFAQDRGKNKESYTMRVLKGR